ncbi:hypothetical protein CCH79_00020379, partial [Gambusia affinis]
AVLLQTQRFSLCHHPEEEEEELPLRSGGTFKLSCRFSQNQAKTCPSALEPAAAQNQNQSLSSHLMAVRRLRVSCSFSLFGFSDPLKVILKIQLHKATEEADQLIMLQRQKSAGLLQLSQSELVPVKVLHAHCDDVTAARFCCGDRNILSCSLDGSAILWDLESSRPLRLFAGVHSRSITECALIPTSNRMVTVSWDRKMVAWDLETGRVLVAAVLLLSSSRPLLTGRPADRLRSWETELDGLLTSCSCSSDGRLLACAAEPQDAVYICAASDGQTLHRISNHHLSTITRVRFDPSDQRVASVSADRTIKLWDVQAKRTTMSIDRLVQRSSLCSRGRCFLSNVLDKHVVTVESNNRDNLEEPECNHSNVVSSCCFNGNGHFLCTASWDKTLKLWDLQGGQFRSQGGTALQRGHEGSVSCCVLSADGEAFGDGGELNNDEAFRDGGELNNDEAFRDGRQHPAVGRAERGADP